MKIVKIKKCGIKNIIKFNNGLKIAVPRRYGIKVGMKLDLKFRNIVPIDDYAGEFALVFTLSNKNMNFNLFINDIFCDDDDEMNLYSAFIDYGTFNIKEAINY